MQIPIISTKVNIVTKHLLKIEDQKNMKKGKYESSFDTYITDRMKVHSENYFGGDAMVGNVEMKFHEEILSGNYGFLECIRDRPAIYRKYKTIWNILSNAKKGFSTKNATKAQLENVAKICETFTEVFPVLFPHRSSNRHFYVKLVKEQ